ncbi:MAG: hypothetical protein M3388_15830 [Acidobacteriota bacterium]|nr:hypothetical protein [Acidobacteriota bacterium]
MAKSWSDLWNDLKAGHKKAKEGYIAVPREGWKGRIIGPKYVPFGGEAEQSDDSLTNESITIEEEIRRKTVKKNRY